MEANAVVGPEVVLCAGSRVAAGVRLERCVVWAGATALAGAAGAVVTREGTVAISHPLASGAGT